MSLLKQNITKKGYINKNVTELDTGNDKSSKYKLEAICDSAVHTKQSENHLPELLFLVFWKSYLKEKNI